MSVPAPTLAFAVMRGRALPVACTALAAALLLPWFYGTDDGQSLTIAGWDTEPGFTVGMLACAAGIAIAGRLGRPLLAVLAAVPAIALTIWMLPRGGRYSGYDLGPGAFVALVVAVLAIAIAARQRLRP
jgi:hypothetical protein